MASNGEGGRLGPIAGDLRDASFAAVLVRVAQAGRTGRLEIAAGPTRRVLAFAEGSLVAVDGANVPGAGEADWLADTVLELCALTEGGYRFEDDLAVPATAGVGPDEILARTDRRLAEWVEVTATVPSTSAIPRLAARIAPGATLSVGDRDWQIIAAVDGQRTVAGIIVETGRGAYDVCAGLARLIGLGAVVLDHGA